MTILDSIAESWSKAGAPPTGNDLRGRFYEDATNRRIVNLAGNYPGIDGFDPKNGIATSLRTHDLSSADKLLKAIEADARHMTDATQRDLTGFARNGLRVNVPAGTAKLSLLSVGVPAADAGIIQDRSFQSALNQVATRFRVMIRVVPIRAWTRT